MCLGEGESWSVAAFDGFQFVGSREAQTDLQVFVARDVKSMGNIFGRFRGKCGRHLQGR